MLGDELDERKRATISEPLGEHAAQFGAAPGVALVFVSEGVPDDPEECGGEPLNVFRGHGQNLQGEHGRLCRSRRSGDSAHGLTIHKIQTIIRPEGQSVCVVN